MMYQMFRLTQQSGVMALEAHFEDPQESAILSRYPKFLASHHAVDFLADSVERDHRRRHRPHDLEALMDEDLEVHHHEALRPAQALAKVGDALPGLGIVAAVLGVVITMGAIDGPPSEIGHKVGAALVGTFLGILLWYGFVGPLATALEHRVDRGPVPGHASRPACWRLQGLPAGDRRRVRAPRVAARRASVVRRDRAVLPRAAAPTRTAEAA